ncbi:MAG TPA: hypothetical protein VFI88_08680 [Sphingomicrobium sp.]|nr:hypothetical protein [Sphingomicrobium sp.]
MIDEIFDRTYRSGRSHANAAVEIAFKRIARAVAIVFAVQHRIEFAAPWQKHTRKRHA